MEEDEVMKQVKIRLRYLVESSPTQMDARKLQHDYLKLLGTTIPLAYLGYKDLVAFLIERCSDSFALAGSASNPKITIIVPDDVVQESKVPSTSKVKSRRRKKRGAKVPPPEQPKEAECVSDSNIAMGRQFKKLKSEIMELITTAPEGVCCSDLIKLYREHYKREMDFTRFGYTSIINLAHELETHVDIKPLGKGDMRLVKRKRCAARISNPSERPVPPTLFVSPPTSDSDDALPGIDFDADVYPADCMGCLEPIPSQTLTYMVFGSSFQTMVGEVYSPSHFWLILLGECHSFAMEKMMDEMSLYYWGEARERRLTWGSVRVGQYCAGLFAGDWHRSVIVKIVDSGTVKIRHVDYGTVDTVPVSKLRPLLRRFAQLPAQAMRARLACVQPCAAGQPWPHAASMYLLSLVRDAHFEANVLAVDRENNWLETLLIDKRGEEEMCVSNELIRAGHAVLRSDCTIRMADCYLFPTFDALECGDTPNISEIDAYLRNGIALHEVEAYRLHVLVSPPEPAVIQPASRHVSEDSTFHDIDAACSSPSPDPGLLDIGVSCFSRSHPFAPPPPLPHQSPAPSAEWAPQDPRPSTAPVSVLYPKAQSLKSRLSFGPHPPPPAGGAAGPQPGQWFGP